MNGFAPDAPARLLVVDDVPANCELLARRLKRLGHEVAIAEDGIRALESLRGGEFDLVLLDITMPGMDGYQVLETMKTDEALRHVPVVMVSAIDESESVVRCLELGADDYLPKPFDPAVLRARVESSLARKRLRDAERRQLQAIARELEIGRRIQSGFLPESLPRLDGWDIGARFLPARQVAGDFYDVFPVGDGIALVVADVCDKGVGAALYMALFRSLIRAIATQQPDADAHATLARTARATSDYIATVHGSSNMFATAFVAVLDPRSGELAYVNAGHDAPLHARAGGAVERLGTTGPALGILPGQRFGIGATRIEPGDLLLAFTDGVTDAGTPAAPFGEAGILARIAQRQGAVDGLLDQVVAGIEAFGDELPDDVTMLAIGRAVAA
ncbi:SpoIIE family protein phosphatase [Burkholderiaceae bacterium FT117]|uniref:PP2C family protein-serine/threonine phosphatase n=1 Tax=Zeimonas sediminis TaxID=2944268 RepID=UPI0023430BBB|nr:SpoIIE family protein phosphatase [Zeimonas sediminis]MCM5571634.1 SpoIIE family protein phosphatase [Zeimonas sediminis]